MAVKKGYKQTEVGVIPVDWEVQRLGEITLRMTNGFVGPAIRHYTENSDGVLYIQGYNVKENSFNFHGVKYVTYEFHKANTKSCLRLGDMLTVQTGEVGLTTVVPENLVGANCHALIISRFDRARVYPLFVSFYLNSKPGRARMRLIETGTTMKHLNVGDMLHLMVPFPSLREQEAIAGALSDADAWIESLGQLIAKKRQIKQGAMQELLTGKRRLPGFSAEWETKRMEDHCQFLRNGTNSRAELTVEGSLKYLHYGDIHSCKGVYICPKCLPSLPRSKANTLDRLQDGDLVLADASEDTIGISKSVEIVDSFGFELVAGLHTIAVRFSEGIFAPRYAGYLQHCPDFNSHLRKLAAGTKVYATNRRHVSSAEIRIPSINEQTAIATVLSDMDTEIESLESKLAKTREIKQGMMHELLTGRIRLI